MLLKKRAMLAAEGVSLEAAGNKVSSAAAPAPVKVGGRKRKLAEADSAEAGEEDAKNTSHVRVAPGSVYRFD
jgi:hypothetical protein